MSLPQDDHNFKSYDTESRSMLSRKVKPKMSIKKLKSGIPKAIEILNVQQDLYRNAIKVIQEQAQDIRNLDDAIQTWCARPTKDGAKRLKAISTRIYNKWEGE